MAARERSSEPVFAITEPPRPIAPLAAPPAFTTMQVQEFTTDSATGLRRLVRERNYIRMREAPEAPPMFLQSGACWMESGERVDPVPDWVLARVAQMPAAVREAVGWRD